MAPFDYDDFIEKKKIYQIEREEEQVVKLIHFMILISLILSVSLFT